MKKRLVTGFLIFTLLVGILPVFAANPTLKVEISNVAPKVNDVVTVKLVTTETIRPDALDVALTYDTASWEYVPGTAVFTSEIANVVTTIDAYSGEMAVRGYADYGTMSLTGTIIEAKFKAVVEKANTVFGIILTEDGYTGVGTENLVVSVAPSANFHFGDGTNALTTATDEFTVDLVMNSFPRGMTIIDCLQLSYTLTGIEFVSVENKMPGAILYGASGGLLFNYSSGGFSAHQLTELEGGVIATVTFKKIANNTGNTASLAISNDTMICYTEDGLEYYFEDGDMSAVGIADITFGGTTPPTIPIKYTVTFKDHDGTVLETHSVSKGTIPVYRGKTPVKAEDADYTYKFAGWSPSIKATTADTVYKATYTAIPKLLSEPDTTATIYGTIGTAEIEAGSNEEIIIPITLTGSYGAHDYFILYDATKLNFVGHVNGLGTYAESQIYEVQSGKIEVISMNAVTSKNQIVYKLKFTLRKTAVAGDRIVLSYEEDLDNGNCFFNSNWDIIDDVSVGSGWIDVKRATTNPAYTITFVDEDGTTVLETITVGIGQIPTYAVIPTKKSVDERYTYLFAGWEPKLVEVTEDATYKATYEQKLKSFNVKYIGGFVGEETVEYGNDVILPIAEEGYTYEFIANGKKWDGKNITSDVTVTVVKIINKYTVTYVGDYSKTEIVEYNGNVTLPSEEGYTYSFTANGEEWDGKNITSDVTVTVVKTINKYTVTYVGDYIGTEIVEYKNDVILPVAEEGYTYNFTANGKLWNGKNITSDITVTVVKTINKYTVTYKGDYTGRQIVEFKGDATLPSQEGYTYSFTVNGEEWDGKNITSDVTVTVVKTINKYTVTYAGDYSKTEIVEYNSNVILPSEEGYTYSFTVNGEEWNGKNIKSDVIVTVVKTINKYTVTYVGDYIGTEIVEYKNDVILPVAEEGYTYSFTSGNKAWDGKGVVSDITVVVTKKINVYTVVFQGDYIGATYVEHGSDVVLPSMEGYVLIFTLDGKNWSGKNITSDVTVNVVKIIKMYTIKYIGDYVGITTVKYGENAVLPVKEGYTYTFKVNGNIWDGKNVTTDLTVEVISVINKYTVIYLGDYVAAQVVDYGADAVLPIAPDGYIYTFTVDGELWDGKNIKTDIFVNVVQSAKESFEVEKISVLNYKFNLNFMPDSDCMLYVCAYDDNHTLVGTTSSSLSMGSYSGETVGIINVSAQPKYFKAYIWDEYLAPLNSPFEFFFDS